MAEMFVQLCLGPTMVSRQGRHLIGVTEGSMVSIVSIEHGTSIHRKLGKIVPDLIPLTDPNTIYLTHQDMKLMGVEAGDPVEVVPSAECLELP